MYSPIPPRGPATRFQWWFAGLFLVLVLGLFIADIIHDYTPIKLSAVLVLFFWIPLLAFHEAGHALAAYLLGWQVRLIVIGMGRIIGRFGLGSTRVEIRLIPIEGFVRCLPTNLFFPQVKHALIYLAGPGVEIALALLILIVVGPDRLLSPSDDYQLIVWQSLAFAAVAQGIMNLIPAAVVTHEGEVYSDGLGFLSCLFRKHDFYVAMKAYADETSNDDTAGTG